MVPAVCQAIVKGLYIESLISKGGAILSPFIDEKKPAKNSSEGGEKSGRCGALELMWKKVSHTEGRDQLCQMLPEGQVRSRVRIDDHI